MKALPILSVSTLLLLALTGVLRPVAAGGDIYRCQALNGTPIFQDQPCNQADGTREARDGREGVRLPSAPPPAEEAAVVAERYRRYLEQAGNDRREQAAADSAAADRLRAEAAANSQPEERDEVCDDPYVVEADQRCRDRGWSSERIYPVFVPYRGPFRPRPPVINPRPPVVAPVPGEGTRPTRPPPRIPRDPRAEILDTRR
ncbi:DUF4124 domain-containing protein [Nevskia ramosa]|uniref:DUF4124 domain-containing protein n=1 Tax=Nevskia ramosa TaxID=64002 RepID=UPI0003B36CF7|nr:DUF4124 domain-containing protein [Nevskia ramosa]